MELKYEFDNGMFIYYVDIAEIFYVIKNKILKNKSREELIDIIMNNDTSIEEYLIEELLEYYEKDAYTDACATDNDPMGWNSLFI